ncbi:MAG: hypothetical protein IH804_02220 [Planctomycetes bacterium]|nr:hypothetical protein [Planctomycetota bacterium]
MNSSAVILAVASPPGRSVRGIVRISGASTFELLQGHVGWPEGTKELREKGTEGNGAGLARARLTLDNLELPLVLLRFRAPHSYTGEHSAELQLPGNPVLLERVIDDQDRLRL